MGSPGMFQTGTSWVAKLEVLAHWKKPVKEADRVHIHVGTGKREARIHLLEANQCEPGKSMLAQFFFEEPISAGFKEKVVIRYLSPEVTLGGAELTWAVDMRLKKFDSRLKHLSNLDTDAVDKLIFAALEFFQKPLNRRDIAKLLSVAESKIHSILLKPELFRSHQDSFIKTETFEVYLAEIQATLETYHQNQPLGKGLPREQLSSAPTPLREFILASALQSGILKNQGDLWQVSGHQGDLDETDSAMKENIIKLFTESNYASPSMETLKSELDAQGNAVLQWMIQNKVVVRVDKDFYLLEDQITHFLKALRHWFKSQPELTIAQAREIIPTTRKYLLPMLNYAERKGLLVRDGDIRRWVGEEL